MQNSKSDPIGDAIRNAEEAKREHREREIETARQAPVQAQAATTAVQGEIVDGLAADLKLSLEIISDFAQGASVRTFALKHPSGLALIFRVVTPYGSDPRIAAFMTYGNQRRELELAYSPDREVFRRNVAELKDDVIRHASDLVR